MEKKKKKLKGREACDAYALLANELKMCERRDREAI